MKKSKLITLGLLAAGACAGAYALARLETRRFKREHKSIRIMPGMEMPCEIIMKKEKLVFEQVESPQSSEFDFSPEADEQNAAWRTLKVLHISDLHLSARESMEKLDFLTSVTDAQYDLILLTGDIFQHDESVIYAPYLISRRPRLGAYAVLGNHDYYRYSMFNKIIGRIFPKFRHPAKKSRDTSRLVAALQAVGYEVLRDQSKFFEDDNVLLIGADFPVIDEDLLESLVKEKPEAALRIAMFHLPKDLEIYERAGIDIAFCGHTHGGQIRVPGIGALITDSDLKRKEASGITTRGRTVFHISRGLSADPRTNIRFLCPPEASIVELTYVGTSRMNSGATGTSGATNGAVAFKS